MVDAYGNIVTTTAGLENLVLEQYEERLKALEIRKGLEMHKVWREELSEKRLEEAQGIKTPDWTLQELQIVLTQLKKQQIKRSSWFFK